MTDRIRTLGGFTIAFGVLWFAAGIVGAVSIDVMVGDSRNPLDLDMESLSKTAFLVAGTILAAIYGAAGAGLLMGQSWGRAATLALCVFSLTLPLLGWAWSIAAVTVLTHDREDPEFGVRTNSA